MAENGQCTANRETNREQTNNNKTNREKNMFSSVPLERVLSQILYISFLNND